MPTWSGLLQELVPLMQALQRGQTPVGVPAGVHPCDHIRRRYLATLHAQTGRNVILYASKWTQAGVEPELISITIEDLQGFMEVVHGLTGSDLDLILHSPGGSPEATAALVSYVRSKFDNVRVFVPHAAMSAATMLACSGNGVDMGKHSFLGPIDPQFIIQTELGRVAVAAAAIQEQFEMAKAEILKSPSLLPVWLPILRQYGPDLLIRCQLAQKLSESLVETWLTQYMFGGAQKAKAKAIAKKLASHATFMSHNRFIDRSEVKALGLNVIDLEADQALQDNVLSVFHAATHTFNMTPTVKIIENHLGKAFLKMGQQVLTMGMGLQPPMGPVTIPQPPQPPSGPH